jgi:hypothetical protein
MGTCGSRHPASHATLATALPLSSRPERSAVEGPAVRRLILGNVFRKPIPQPLQPESPLFPCHPDRSVAKWRDLQCALRLSQIHPRKRSQRNHPLGIRPSPQPDFACRGCGTRLSNNINTTGSTPSANLGSSDSQPSLRDSVSRVLTQASKSPTHFHRLRPDLKSCPDTKPKFSQNRISRFKSWTPPNVQKPCSMLHLQPSPNKRTGH